MKMKRKILLFVITIISVISLSAQDYFVSATTGSDANDGLTWQTAFATIDKAVSLVRSTAGTHNIYVAKGNYMMNTTHDLLAGVQLNLYGGFPVPTAYTPPTDKCNYNPTENVTEINSTSTESTFRLYGNGGGLTMKYFTYNSKSGGLYNGTFITLDGNNNNDAMDSKNKTIILEEMIFPEYRSSSSGFIYAYAAEDSKFYFNDIYVGSGGWDGTGGGGGAFFTTRGYTDGAAVVPASKNIDVYVNNSSFNNIDTYNLVGGAVFYMDQDYNVDQGTSSLTIDKSSFCNKTSNTVAGNVGVIYVAEMKELRVTNSYFGNNYAVMGTAITTFQTGKLYSENNTFQNNIANDRGGAINIFGTYAGLSTLTDIEKTNEIIGSKFYNNKVNNLGTGGGGAIYVLNSHILSIKNSEFQGNSSADYGGAIRTYDSNDAVSISGTKFCSNTAGQYGGAIDIGASGDVTGLLTLENSYFNGNKAGYDGGAVRTKGNISITGSQFYYNIANTSNTLYDGGALHLTANRTATITTSVFYSNSADEGGAIYKTGGNTLTVSNSYFAENKATASFVDPAYGGGAVYVGGSTFNSTSNIYDGNTSGTSGGAVYINNTFSSNSDKFYNNQSTGKGGALYLFGNSTIATADFYNNSSGNDGGAIGIYGTSTNFSLSSSKFFQNKTSKSGGALYFYNDTGGTNSLTNNEFYANTATDNGGAIYIQDGGAGDEIDAFDRNKFYQNVASGSYKSNLTQNNDIYLYNDNLTTTLGNIKSITNSSLQLTPNSTNYPNNWSGNGYHLGAGNTQQTTALTVITPSYTLPTAMTCPTIPAPACKTMADVLPPYAFMTTNGDMVNPQTFKSICFGEAASTSVMFYSETGKPGFTFEYKIETINDLTVGTSSMSEIKTISSGTANNVSTLIPTPTEKGVTYRYWVTKITDANGLIHDYSACNGALMAIVNVQPVPQVELKAIVNCDTKLATLTSTLIPVATNTEALTNLGAAWTNSTTAVAWRWVGPNGITASTKDFVTGTSGDYVLTVTDNNGCSTQATINVNVVCATLSGKVYLDTDYLSDTNNPNGISDGTNAGTNGGGLYVVLVDANNIVLKTVKVANDGTYLINGIEGAAKAILTINNPAVGSELTSSVLNTGYIHTGASIDGTTTPILTNPLGIVTLPEGENDKTVNFGVKLNGISVPANHVESICVDVPLDPDGKTSVNLILTATSDMAGFTLAGKTINIISVTGATLKYNGNSVADNTSITGFVPSSLTVDYTNSGQQAPTEVSIKYSVTIPGEYGAEPLTSQSGIDTYRLFYRPIFPLNTVYTINSGDFFTYEGDNGTYMRNYIAATWNIQSKPEGLILNGSGQGEFSPPYIGAINDRFYNTTDKVQTVTYSVYAKHKDSDNPSAVGTCETKFTLTVLVLPAKAVGDNLLMPQGTSASGNVLNNDINLSTVTSVTIGNVTTPLNPVGPTTITTDNGVFVINPDGNYTFTPSPNFTGNIDIIYNATDEPGDISKVNKSATLTIEVIPTATQGNNPPVAVNDSYTMPENSTSPATIDLLANDYDPDSDPITLDKVEWKNPQTNMVVIIPLTGGTVNITDETGKTIGTAEIVNNKLVFTPVEGFTGTVPFTYTISDGKGGTDTADIEINVVPVIPDPNNPTVKPIFATDDNFAVTYGGSLTENIFVNDNFGGQTLTSLTVDGQPIASTGTTTITIPGKGILTVSFNGDISFKATDGFVGTVSVPYEVCVDGICDKAMINIASIPPYVQANPDINPIPQGTTATGNVLTNDENLTTVTKITINGVDYPVKSTGETSIPVTGGTLVIDAQGNYSFTPGVDYTGELNITYTAVNKDGFPESSTLNIDVIPTTTSTNNPPVANNDTYTVEQSPTGTTPAVTVNILANDFDPDGDKLTVKSVTAGGTTLTNSPQNISINGVVVGSAYLDVSGNIIFTPTPGFVGTVPFEYTATDGMYDDSAIAYINVTGYSNSNNMFANDDVAQTIPGVSVTGNVLTNDQLQGTLNPITVSYLDPNGTPIVFTIDGKTENIISNVGTLVIDGNGNYTFTPFPDYIGNTNVTYTICNTDRICSDANLNLVSIMPTEITWVGTNSTVWDIATNWNPNIVPGVNGNVVFDTNAINNLEVPVGVDKAKIIYNLTNNTELATVVPPGASLTINGTIIGSETNPDKLLVEADPNGTIANGSLIITGMDCNVDVMATVEFKAKGVVGDVGIWQDDFPGSPDFEITKFTTKYHWQFFGIPVKEIPTAFPTFANSYVRQYFENWNGDNKHFYQKWKNISGTSPLKAFAGYEITHDVLPASPYSIKGALNFCDNQVLTLTRMAPFVEGASRDNAHYGLGQNIFGNSYTAAIKISEMHIPDIVEKTVYLYNTGRFYDWAETGVVSQTLQAGNYLPIPQNASLVWDNQIPSMQGFLLHFLPEATIFGAAPANVLLSYADGGVMQNKRPQLAPKSAVTSNQRINNNNDQENQKKELAFLKINLQSKSTIDNLWLFSQEGTSERFDNGWDGRKYFGTPTAFIYTETPDGPMQVNTNSTIDGNVISFFANYDTEYALTLIKSNLGQYSDLHLIDLEAKTVTPLLADSTLYRFTSNNKNVVDARFLLVNKPTSEIDLASDEFKSLSGYITPDKTLVATNYSGQSGTMTLHNAAGMLVMTKNMESGTNRYSTSLQEGIYIMTLQAGVNKKSVKLVVR